MVKEIIYVRWNMPVLDRQPGVITHALLGRGGVLSDKSVVLSCVFGGKLGVVLYFDDPNECIGQIPNN